MRASILLLADVENGKQPRANDRRGFGTHPGQLLQRFFADTMTDSKTGNLREKRDPAELRALLDAAIAAAKNVSLLAIYRAAYDRWNDSFPKDELNRSETLTTTGRLIVGLGSENVLETGIRLHHTYGVPLIPGSALKGLASHYCHEVWGQRFAESPDENTRSFRREERYHRLLFGTTEDGGAITFQDAWITPDSLRDSALRLDVMTPHHLKWQSNESPPTDFDSPTPVSFLSVAGTFQIRLCWSGPVDAPSEQAQAWTRLAMKLLREALTQWGVGGKTSSGYGRLIDSPGPPVIPGKPNAVVAAQPSKSKNLPKTQETVEGEIVPDPKGKGRLFARLEESGLVGPIQKPEDVPEQERQPGTKLSLIVATISIDGRQIQFLYPTPANQQRAQHAKRQGSRGKPPGSRGKR